MVTEHNNKILQRVKASGMGREWLGKRNVWIVRVTAAGRYILR
jgi:hypothetical protein